MHYTDVNLLYDAMRCLMRDVARAAGKFDLPGWRQHRQLERSVRLRYNRVRHSRRRRDSILRAGKLGFSDMVW